MSAEIALGFALGRISRGVLLSACLIAISIGVLISLLYQFCDVRQCYYAGPDGTGSITLGVLLFALATTGLLVGRISTQRFSESRVVNSILFGTVIGVLVGYYPAAFLFGAFLTNELGLGMLIFGSALSFFFAGMVSSLFSHKKRHAMCCAAAAWGILAALFSNPSHTTAAPLLALVLLAGTPAAVLGFISTAWFTSTRKKRVHTIMFPTIIASFALGAVHPFLDAPMNLSTDDGSQSIIGRPTYYAGAYQQSEGYFGTKRVEVQVNLKDLDRSYVKDFILAGIGAQSPNCCKDGLDYGYRADLLLTEPQIFLVARAWETCDQNVACSGFPWISVMHERIVPLPMESDEYIMLAMEWQRDDRTVNWYYGTKAGNWSIYSSFSSPEIENPYFNLGILPVGNPLTNPDTGNAFFYQAGISVPEWPFVVREQVISFKCPAYYDRQGVRHCVEEMTPIKAGNSHWKVLWKWGAPMENTVSVTTDGSNVTIVLR